VFEVRVSIYASELKQIIMITKKEMASIASARKYSSQP
jgi:hypothetical protein